MEAGRTLVVGDIQGCADDLEDLLAAVRFRPGQDRLIAAGDLVNRGPSSLRVLRRLHRLHAYLVLGNHDLHLLAVKCGRRHDPEATFGDVLAAEDRDALLDWLVDRPQPLVWSGDAFAVVHAGVPPDFAFPADAAAVNHFVRSTWQSDAPLAARVGAIVTDPRVRFLTNARYTDPAGRTPPDAEGPDPPGFRPWFELRHGGPTIAFGHWARLNPARARLPGFRHLDTGCVYGGALTGWLVEEDRLVAVPARRAYWPPPGAPD
jgi:bis(5'-nucleosyl)-tetraphosphatase (symmetrical)